MDLEGSGLSYGKKYIDCTLKSCSYFKIDSCRRRSLKDCPGFYLEKMRGTEVFLNRCGWAMKILSIPLQDYGVYRLNGGPAIRIEKSSLTTGGSSNDKVREDVGKEKEKQNYQLDGT
ncbi:MAG: hypothetical protein GTN76_07185, partial [Candidatus Aenigmarchaeota archaeon]|nr:hypothetical protein [Candidatus Aenigmarchaeota archaeon]